MGHLPANPDRREFLRQATALGIAGAGVSVLPAFAADGTAAANPLDLAEWSYFWLGVRRAHLAKGTVVNGEQMYVESFVPAQVRHPFSIVCVHGGGGQGT